DEFLVRQIAADPSGTIDTPRDDGAGFVDNLHHAAGRKRVRVERFVEAFEQNSGGEDGPHLACIILDRTCNGCDPLAGGTAMDRLPHCEVLTTENGAEEVAVAKVAASAFRLARRPDVAAGGR